MYCIVLYYRRTLKVQRTAQLTFWRYCSQVLQVMFICHHTNFIFPVKHWKWTQVVSIQEVPVSHLGRNTDYPERFRALPQSLYANAEKLRRKFPNTAHFYKKAFHHSMCRSCTVMDPDISVGIPTRYGLEATGIESRWERGFPRPSRLALGPTRPPV